MENVNLQNEIRLSRHTVNIVFQPNNALVRSLSSNSARRTPSDYIFDNQKIIRLLVIPRFFLSPTIRIDACLRSVAFIRSSIEIDR